MSYRKRRVYFAVMILSGLALFTDRFVLSDGVTTPDAVAASSAAVVRPSDSPAPAARDAPAIPELPFPRGVDRFTFASEIRDLFAAPSAALKGKSRLPGAGENSPFPEDGTRPRGLDQAAFQAGHELGGVLDHERLKIAIIDGRWLRIGDKVDGCTLTRISGDTVCFECYDGEAVLKPSRGRGAIGD